MHTEGNLPYAVHDEESVNAHNHTVREKQPTQKTSNRSPLIVHHVTIERR
jgi:hypothetical protein